jgi:uncharacterized protein YndB with AHSA1/START domain
MAVDRIEREIEIDAPIESVWAVITEPEQMSIWFSGSADLDVRPGGEGQFVWREKESTRVAMVNVRVERCEPPHFFSFRWHHPDGAEPAPSNAPLVEFRLESNGNSTLLRLVESGLDQLALSENEKDEYFGDHSRGWDVIVARLREHAEKRIASSPIGG